MSVADQSAADQAPPADQAVKGDQGVHPDMTGGDTLRSDSVVRDGQLTCPPPAPNALFVDATYVGNQNGSSACPFKTITQALKVAGKPSVPFTIFVADGTYDAVLGETFPLQVPANVTVEGGASGSACTRGATIDGDGTASSFGTAAVWLTGNLDCLTIEDFVGDANALVLVTVGTESITQCTLVQGDAQDIWVHGTDSAINATISACDVSGALGDGIMVDRLNVASVPAPTVTITSSAIHNNGIDGVGVVAGQVTVGYARLPVCSTGRLPNANDIYCNLHFGVEGQAGGTPVPAEGNAWNHYPPLAVTAPSDIPPSGSVDAACPAPVSKGACP
jgi:hypothetical protein